MNCAPNFFVNILSYMMTYHITLNNNIWELLIYPHELLRSFT